MDVTIRGVEKLRSLHKALDEQGKKLRPELVKGLKAAAEPLMDDVRQAARDTLPSRGGLAEVIASSDIRLSVRTSGERAAVRLTGKNKVGLQQIDKGKVRHPTYGRRPWVSQSVRAGFWTDTLTKSAPKVRESLVAVLDAVAAKIRRSV